MKLIPIEKRTVVDGIVDQIKSLIIKGELKPGDKLDPERILAQKFQVGRPAIREGLRVLISLGLVKKTHEGNLINPQVMETLGEPLLLKFLLNHTDIKDLFEARKILEVEVIKLALHRRHEKHLIKMNGYLTAMEREEDYLSFAENDIAFHLCIAEASGNQVFFTFLSTIKDLLRHSIIKLLSKKEIIHDALYFHQLIYKALLEQDRDLAIESIYHHLEHAEKNLIGLIEEDK